MAKGKEQSSLFPETQEILALLSKESPQDIVIIVIPSHDRKNKALAEPLTAEWASNAMKLLADLYEGATAYLTYKGIYKTDEGHYLWDNPRLIESFAMIDDIQDSQKLNLLVDFAKRMGKTLDQASVMLVFGTCMYYIKDYSGV